jgi:hypothetical protein
MATKKDDRLAWGVTLLVFGLLFLIRQLHLLPDNISVLIFDIRNYPLIMGAIFLLLHSNKSVGLVLVIVGLLFRLSDIIRCTKHLSDFILPSVLVLVGIILIFGVKKGKK